MRDRDKPGCGFFRSKAGIAVLVFGAITAFFMIAEHQVHLWGWLPYLLLLACPLMHVFMHRGHGAHGHARGEPRVEASAGAPGMGEARQREGDGGN